MPDPRERRGDEQTSRAVENDEPESQDRPDRPGQPGDLESRDRRGKVSPRTPDQAEGERGDGA